MRIGATDGTKGRLLDTTFGRLVRTRTCTKDGKTPVTHRIGFGMLLGLILTRFNFFGFIKSQKMCGEQKDMDRFVAVDSNTRVVGVAEEEEVVEVA